MSDSSTLKLGLGFVRKKDWSILPRKYLSIRMIARHAVQPHNGVETCYKSTNWFGRFEDIGRQTQWHFYANCVTLLQYFNCSVAVLIEVVWWPDSVTVRVLAYKVAASNLGKLFTHVPLSSSIIWYRSHQSHDSDAYGWEGNRRYGVALAMHNRARQ